MIGRQLYRHGFLPETGAAEKAQSTEARICERGAVLQLSADDLPAVCPHAAMPLWSSHPRVYLEVVNESEAMCPYCGTRYRLRRDACVHDHRSGARNLHQHRRHGAESQSEESGDARSSGDQGPEFANQSADAFGNTRLELITRWLRHGRT